MLVSIIVRCDSETYFATNISVQDVHCVTDCLDLVDSTTTGILILGALLVQSDLQRGVHEVMTLVEEAELSQEWGVAKHRVFATTIEIPSGCDKESSDGCSKYSTRGTVVMLE